MKKIIATLMLLMCVSVAFAGTVGDKSEGAILNPKKQALCHDDVGKWNAQDKSCDPADCGCLFHQIEEFIVDIFS